MSVECETNSWAENDNQSRALEALMTPGASFFSPPVLDSYYVFIGPDNVNGTALSKGRVKKLEKQGLIKHSGVDRYCLSCKICGCTHFEPCDPPCGWAEPGLCTSCTSEPELDFDNTDVLEGEV